MEKFLKLVENSQILSENFNVVRYFIKPYNFNFKDLDYPLVWRYGANNYRSVYSDDYSHISSYIEHYKNNEKNYGILVSKYIIKSEEYCVCIKDNSVKYLFERSNDKLKLNSKIRDVGNGYMFILKTISGARIKGCNIALEAIEKLGCKSGLVHIMYNEFKNKYYIRKVEKLDKDIKSFVIELNETTKSSKIFSEIGYV